MVDPNPFEPPTESNRLQESRSKAPIGRLTMSLLASIVASAPSLGYYVHASRTEQMVAVWLGLAWILGVIFAVILTATIVAWPNTHRVVRIIESSLLIYLLIASLVGFGGVRNAVRELLAG